MNVKQHLAERVAHARRAKHLVLGSMVLAAVCAAAGYELVALALHGAANLIWIYET